MVSSTLRAARVEKHDKLQRSHPLERLSLLVDSRRNRTGDPILTIDEPAARASTRPPMRCLLSALLSRRMAPRYSCPAMISPWCSPRCRWRPGRGGVRGGHRQAGRGRPRGPGRDGAAAGGRRPGRPGTRAGHRRGRDHRRDPERVPVLVGAACPSRWRWSPTGASPAAPTASWSPAWRPRPPPAARSGWSAPATRSPSTSPPAGSPWRSPRRSCRRGTPSSSRPRRPLPGRVRQVRRDDAPGQPRRGHHRHHRPGVTQPAAAATDSSP
jgi:hypothetical protein